ncbi:hypothetical protein H9P43_000891 [Blastocladiella emersonii ATCC 22665]|nr:hypothetical protein H9P43_000891 [Blastocladiella emersonii ATCC 22665]
MSSSYAHAAPAAAPAPPRSVRPLPPTPADMAAASRAYYSPPQDDPRHFMSYQQQQYPQHQQPMQPMSMPMAMPVPTPMSMPMPAVSQQPLQHPPASSAPAPPPKARGASAHASDEDEDDDDGPFACLWRGCEQVFLEPEALFSHLTNDHIGRKTSGNLCLRCAWILPDGKSECGIEKQKRDHITSHLRVHVPLKPHVCTACSKRFKRPQDLKKHERVHLPLSPDGAAAAPGPSPVNGAAVAAAPAASAPVVQQRLQHAVPRPSAAVASAPVYTAGPAAPHMPPSASGSLPPGIPPGSVLIGAGPNNAAYFQTPQGTVVAGPPGSALAAASAAAAAPPSPAYATTPPAVVAPPRVSSTCSAPHYAMPMHPGLAPPYQQQQQAHYVSPNMAPYDPLLQTPSPLAVQGMAGRHPSPLTFPPTPDSAVGNGTSYQSNFSGALSGDVVHQQQQHAQMMMQLQLQQQQQQQQALPQLLPPDFQAAAGPAPATRTTAPPKRALDDLDELDLFLEEVKKQRLAPTYDANVAASLDHLAPGLVSGNLLATPILSTMPDIDSRTILGYLDQLETNMCATDPDVAFFLEALATSAPPSTTSATPDPYGQFSFVPPPMSVASTASASSHSLGAAIGMSSPSSSSSLPPGMRATGSDPFLVPGSGSGVSSAPLLPTPPASSAGNVPLPEEQPVHAYYSNISTSAYRKLRLEQKEAKRRAKEERRRQKELEREILPVFEFRSVGTADIAAADEQKAGAAGVQGKKGKGKDKSKKDSVAQKQPAPAPVAAARPPPAQPRAHPSQQQQSKPMAAPALPPRRSSSHDPDALAGSMAGMSLRGAQPPPPRPAAPTPSPAVQRKVHHIHAIRALRWYLHSRMQSQAT